MGEDFNVEVGPREFPLIRELRPDLYQGGDIVYFDKRKGWADSLKYSVDKKLTPSTYRESSAKEYVVVGNAASLPIKEESAGLIFASNLFGAHVYGFFDPGRKYNHELENIGDFDKIAGEWNRAVSKNGKVVIFETSSPRRSQEEELVKLFKRNGFVLAEEHQGLSEINKIFDPESKLVTGFEKTGASDSYALVFEKA